MRKVVSLPRISSGGRSRRPQPPVSVFAVVGVWCLSATAGFAEVSSVRTTEFVQEFSAAAGGGSFIELKGAEIPEYHRVETLFGHLHAVLGPPESDDEFWLTQLTISPGGAAELVLRNAISDWHELTFGGPDSAKWETVLPDGSIETTEVAHVRRPGEVATQLSPEDVREKELHKARELARIYHRMLNELQDAGFDIEQINSYINTEVVPAMVVLTDGGPSATGNAFASERRILEENER